MSTLHQQITALTEKLDSMEHVYQDFDGSWVYHMDSGYEDVYAELGMLQELADLRNLHQDWRESMFLGCCEGYV